MPDRTESPQETGTGRSGLLSHMGLFLARGLDRLDNQVSPRVLRFLADTRVQFRLHPEGMGELLPGLRKDLQALASEYARLLGRQPERPAEPAPPSGDLVSIQGALTRPDLPVEEPRGPAASGPAEAPPADEEVSFQAGQAAPSSNYRCSECDAVITLAEKGMLPPCDCGGRGWVRLD